MNEDNRYQPLAIEAKWQQAWQQKRVYEADLDAPLAAAKFYAFAMFCYPSGEGIHIGHVKNFLISDVLIRYHRQNGWAVYSPVGFDSFGLPAENFAIKTGAPPRVTTDQAIANYSAQFKACGFSFDWSKKIDTSQPEYYRWTQWCFLQFLKTGRAYQKESSQWWCELCCTILADEQVHAGKCWRHDGSDDPLVSSKSLKQWFLRITDYADEILAATPALEWTAWVKTAQENHIGRSEGTEIAFKLKGLNLSAGSLKVFTTALDTIYGATFMVLAPEHPLVEEILSVAGNATEIREYVRTAQSKSEVARQQAKIKTGIKVAGLQTVNPLTGAEMSVWVADYVLAGYGTGAMMAVPGADERDLEFAQQYDLEIIYPTDSGGFTAYKDIREDPRAYRLVTTDDLNGLDMAEAKLAIFSRLEKLGVAEKKINYRLRDWLISRQRYWGAPIPIVYCEACGVVPVKEGDLPIKLPLVEDYKPAGDGRSPLAKAEDWVKTNCPACAQPAVRETDTLDTFVCSSWYQMRYLAPHNAGSAWDPAVAKAWFPVDFYNGGDHATAHLLYARFFTRFFYDQGLLPTPEPFPRMYFHGKINAPDGQPMSKSKGTGINPMDIIKQGYGADALRVYVCSMAPPDLDAAWSHDGVPAAYRFLNRVWSLTGDYLRKSPATAPLQPGNPALLRALNCCIAKTSGDIGRLKYNTAIAALMELVNTLYKVAAEDDFRDSAWPDCFQGLAMLLAPFAPHLASEIWQRIGQEDLIDFRWPELDENYLTAEMLTVPVQVNGKLRGQIEISPGASEAEVVEAARQLDAVARHLAGAQVKQAIYVPDKIVNFVV